MCSSDGALILKTRGDFPNCSLARRAQDAKNKTAFFFAKHCSSGSNGRRNVVSEISGTLDGHLLPWPRKRRGIILYRVRVGAAVRQLLRCQCMAARGRLDK